MHCCRFPPAVGRKMVSGRGSGATGCSGGAWSCCSCSTAGESCSGAAACPGIPVCCRAAGCRSVCCWSADCRGDPGKRSSWNGIGGSCSGGSCSGDRFGCAVRAACCEAPTAGSSETGTAAAAIAVTGGSTGVGSSQVKVMFSSLSPGRQKARRMASVKCL